MRNSFFQTSIEYSIDTQANNYVGGFTLNIIIMNIGSVPIEGWEIFFDFPGNEVISSFWNVATFQQMGKSVSATNASWNGTIMPNQSANIGLTAVSDAPFSGILNARLGGEEPPVEFNGNIRVTVTTPNFPPSLFIPQVTVSNTTQGISFGTSYTFTDLPANVVYPITAAPFVSGDKVYSATVTPPSIEVPPNDTVDVTISYTENARNQNVFAGYFPSWSDRWSNSGSMTDLANLPSYVNLVLVAFGVPDMNYSGNLNLQGTGLSFSYTGTVLKEAITLLKSNNPGTTVLISIGGATYTNWGAFNAENIARFVKDFGFDGVDLDFEPAGGFVCSRPCQTCPIECTTDDMYVNLIESMRMLLPRPYVLTTTPFSVGAYGEDQWVNAPPANLATTGMFLNVMARAGDMLDLVLPQGYNAGAVFDPLEATQAYNFYFGRGICMGAHVPPEAWGDHVWTIAEINRVGSYINENNIGGMMMWELYRTNNNPSEDYPDNQMMASAIAKILGFPNFDDPLFPLRNLETTEKRCNE